MTTRYTLLPATLFALAVGGQVFAAKQPATDITTWDYESALNEGWSAKEFLDADVHDQDGDEIGEVEDLIVGPDGVIQAMVIEAGGFLDIGDTHFTYPWKKAQIADMDSVEVAFDKDNIEDYSLFGEIEGEPKKPRSWRISELIDDYAYLAGGVPYGWVDDVIIKNGKVSAVIVQPDVTYGAYAPYAWPFYGYGYGFDPGLDYYEIPYDEDEIAVLDPFDYGVLDDDIGVY